MDYAIYKTIDNGRPTVIKRFTQQDYNHRAKLSARRELTNLWYHFILYYETRGSNINGTKDDFEYDNMTSANTKEHVRFYIGELQDDPNK